eukprot:TRINITY_DN7225_c0_g3_i2.p1 TRINITY_DN7225_c0_g3~~TRINITY_DN7225_c0_g3_i2.p1  ORF type:complete len:944 (-),score=82.85 TRINITY_DN7225_c0_g3_i2:70-2901(-)
MLLRLAVALLQVWAVFALLDCSANAGNLIKGNDDCCSRRAALRLPCPRGAGDCDSDSECQGDLKCGRDNCPWGDGDDCCYADCSANAPNLRSGNDACCTGTYPCGAGEGDCDSDSDCAGSLKCGRDNCPWGDGDDCCYQPTCATSYSCPTGWVANAAKSGSTTLTTANCCRATCDTYSCTNGWVANAATSGSTTLNAASCCRATCALFSCTDGWVANAANSASTTFTAANCCRATCATYSCTTSGWVANTETSASTTVTEANCCQATTTFTTTSFTYTTETSTSSTYTATTQTWTTSTATSSTDTTSTNTSSTVTSTSLTRTTRTSTTLTLTTLTSSWTTGTLTLSSTSITNTTTTSITSISTSSTSATTLTHTSTSTTSSTVTSTLTMSSTSITTRTTTSTTSMSTSSTSTMTLTHTSTSTTSSTVTSTLTMSSTSITTRTTTSTTSMSTSSTSTMTLTHTSTSTTSGTVTSTTNTHTSSSVTTNTVTVTVTATAPPITRDIYLEGDYEVMVLNRMPIRSRYLRECSEKLAPAVCVDVRPGSIILTVAGSNLLIASGAVEFIASQGLDLPSFPPLSMLQQSVSTTDIAESVSNEGQDGGSFLWLGLTACACLLCMCCVAAGTWYIRSSGNSMVWPAPVTSEVRRKADGLWMRTFQPQPQAGRSERRKIHRMASNRDLSEIRYKSLPIESFKRLEPIKNLEAYLREDVMQIVAFRETTARFLESFIAQVKRIAHDVIAQNHVLEEHSGLTEDAVQAVVAFTLEIQMSHLDATPEDEFYKVYGNVLRERQPDNLRLLCGYSHYLFKGLLALPAYTGCLWRGISGRRAVVNGAKNHNKKLMEITWSAFSSASPDRRVAKHFASKPKVEEVQDLDDSIFPGVTGVIFRLEVESCAYDIRSCSAFAAEDERLLLPNTHFLVEEMPHLSEDGVLEIHMREKPEMSYTF